MVAFYYPDDSRCLFVRYDTVAHYEIARHIPPPG